MGSRSRTRAHSFTSAVKKCAFACCSGLLVKRYTVARAPQLQAPLVVPYPPYAARAYREARISALLIIDADGSAVEATLQPDDPLFVPTIEDALRSAKFKPAETDSRPVKHWLILDFVFTMRPPATSRSGLPARPAHGSDC